MSEVVKILHLEDNIYDAELIAMTIKDEGLNCEITHVRNKSEFVDVIQDHEFDVALCDYNVPPFNGVEALKMVKETNPELPVIFVTGTIGEEKAASLLKEGATDYLIKEHTSRLTSAIVRAIQEAEERKNLREAQASVQESEQQYRNIFENTPVGIYRTTPEGEIIAGNPALIKMLGYNSFEELSERNLNKEGFGEDNPRTEFIKLIENHGEVKGLQSIWERKDKARIHVLENAKAIKNENGEIKYYEGTVQDISELKRAQGIIEKSEKLLIESQEIANIGNWELTFDDRTLTWSENYYRLLGYEPFTVQPSQDLFLQHVHPEDRVNMRNHIDKLANQPGVFTSIQRIIRTDGAIRFHSGRGVVEVDDDTGKPIRIYGIVQDVTELKQAENALITAKEKAEESDRLKSQFLAQMSHEIRTPLSAILSTSQLFKADLKDKISEDMHDLLDGIDESGLRIIRTMDSILNMAALQTGTIHYKPVKFNLNSVLEDIIHVYRDLPSSKHLYIEYKCMLPDPMILDDEYLIRQIFQNLFDNAVKFTNEGGVKVKVFNDEMHRPTIEIADTGIGISRSYFPKLFKAFSQESAGYSRGYEGNGLGLALVKKYAEIIKAEISFKSEKGKGSTFVVSLNPNILFPLAKHNTSIMNEA